MVSWVAHVYMEMGRIDARNPVVALKGRGRIGHIASARYHGGMQRRGDWMNRLACVLIGGLVLVTAWAWGGAQVTDSGGYRGARHAGADSTTGDEPTATDHPSIGVERKAGKKKPFLGMNLSNVSYYSRAWVFTDLTLQSDAWREGGRGYIYKTGFAPPGRYISTWTGSGSIRFFADATTTRSGVNSAEVIVRSGKHGIDMQRLGDVGSFSLIKFEDQDRVSPFHQTFLDRLAPFQVLRFMDWANTNNSTQVQWSDRTGPNDRPQAGHNGVAVEYMVSLCNGLKADAWFCMPHLASDDYIRRHAELVKARLHPDAKVYVEYSNEIWNSQFQQHKYVQRLGDSEAYSDAFFDAWAKQCRRTFAIWSQVFGDEASDRLVRVAAVHLANPWGTRQLLPRLEGEFDAVATSAYFGITGKQVKTLNAAATAEDLLDLCEQNIQTDNRGWYERHGQIVRGWSAKLGRPIRLISYEAGQHLSAHGGDPPYAGALIQAQSHPRMYRLYLLNMMLFERAGGDLFTAFNDVSKPSKFGSWGHLAYQSQPVGDAPKYRALIDYLALSDPEMN